MAASNFCFARRPPLYMLVFHFKVPLHAEWWSLIYLLFLVFISDDKQLKRPSHPFAIISFYL